MPEVSMVDVTGKPQVYREAEAYGRIRLKPETVELIKSGRVEKGDPLQAAQLAAVMAAKKTPELIPLCHPLPITHVESEVKLGHSCIEVWCRVKTTARTGVEMEALTAVAVALLVIWDMVKKYEKDEMGQYPSTAIEEIRVVRKFKAS